jgi:hypothetical protein
VDIRGDAAHGVMGRGQYRYGRVGRIDAQIGLAEAGDVGQFAAERFFSQMRGVQMNVVVDTAVAADSLTGPHLGENGTGDDVPWGQIQQGRRIALHETFPVPTAQDAAFAANRLGNQDAQSHDAGGMELKELHVFKGNPAPGAHRRTVAGVGVCIGCDLEHATESAGGKRTALAPKTCNSPVASSTATTPFDVVPSRIRSTTWNSSKKATSFLMHCW